MQLITLLSAATLASAAALPNSLEARNKDVLPGHCCFTLKDSSGNTVQQSSTGQVQIASSQPSGWYCLDLSSSSAKVLRDDPNNACIVDSRGQFMCVDPIPGNVAWTLGSGGELKYGGSTKFSNCNGKVFGGSRSGCKTTTLKASGKKGSC
ncbi:hypothetical protein NLU13_7488 [Sarocladium strictum]|uniref:Uncharacterized protein n=1 Tax=Sarocladium strictum TaxID=5046 RepID=A0AA39L5S7_SARSR|nr:hypothetical protein NLU13_7488 [Sarocladium strictum]